MYSAKLLHGVGLCLLALPVLADPFETWHPRSPLPTANTLNGVAHGNGQFVAVGDNGTIVTSSNGVDWLLAPSGVSVHLNTVVFAAGRFVTGGNSGVLLWSEDGTSWTTGSFPLSNDINGIGFGVGTNYPSGLFVVVCSSNAFSLDMRRPTTILSSSNGAAWSTNTFSLNQSLAELPFTSIAFGNNRFVASGAIMIGNLPSGPRAIQSASGTIWSYTLGSPFGPVTFGNGIFVLATFFQATPNGVSLLTRTSADGVIWPGQNYSGQFFGPQAACFAGGRFVVVGDAGLTANSPDGTNWTTRPVATDAQLRSIAFGDGLYVAVGSRGFIASSADADSWTQRNKGASRNLLAVAAADDGFIAVGAQGAVAWSSNGIAWDTFAAPTANSLQAAIKADGKYVAAGGSGAIVSGDSPSNLTERLSGTSRALQGLAYGNGRFVVVGDAGTILSSSNGADWTTENSGTTGNLIDIVFGNGLFAAVGFDANVLTSSNGSIWTVRPTGAARQLRDIVYGAGRFVATAGNIGSPDTNVFVTVSVDGINWTSVAGVSPDFLAGTSYGNGYFAVFLRTFQPPRIATSTDGISWNSYALLTNPPSATDIAFNNGTFVTVGRFGLISQSDPVVRLDVRYDGMAHLAWEGPKNRHYGILVSESLDEPNSWQEQTTIFSPPFSWTDPQSVGRSNRIYRAVLLPK